ncbi:MAG TPA: hypothetical protein VK666_16810 [Chryseolinea sp.]|jgi:GTP cyclohydrolase I|nr:hypothetical protein [Chryseolinea sp.]
MSKSKKTRKTVRNTVSNRLRETFKDFQEILGEAKFKRNIKKASKAMAKEVKGLTKGSDEVKKKAVPSKVKKVEDKVETA